jgi:hypothetical protein
LAASGVSKTSAPACSAGGRDEIFDEIDKLNNKTRGGDSSAARVTGITPRRPSRRRPRSPTSRAREAVADDIAHVLRSGGMSEDDTTRPL